MKIEKPDISFVEYASLPDRHEYDYYLKYNNWKSNDLFKFGDFTKKSFGFVKDAQEKVKIFLSEEGEEIYFIDWLDYIEVIAEEKELTSKEIARISLFQLHQSKLYLIEQIKNINKFESKKLGHEPTSEEEVAGIDRFNKYRSFLQFDKLMSWYMASHEDVRKLNYGLCILKLVLEKDRVEYDKDIFRIRNPKTK